MNVTGLFRIFPKVINVEGKEITIFETSIGRKTEEGQYVDNYTIRVNFPLELVNAEQRKKFKEEFFYLLDVKESYLTTRGYTAKDGSRKVGVVLMITKFEAKEKKPLNKKPKADTSEKPLADQVNLDDIL